MNMGQCVRGSEGHMKTSDDDRSVRPCAPGAPMYPQFVEVRPMLHSNKFRVPLLTAKNLPFPVSVYWKTHLKSTPPRQLADRHFGLLPCQ